MEGYVFLDFTIVTMYEDFSVSKFYELNSQSLCSENRRKEKTISEIRFVHFLYNETVHILYMKQSYIYISF